MPENKSGRRIIAIQMLPKAYDEILRLKGEETWTKFIIECVLAKVGDNSILQDELKSLVKEPKPKAEKPKKVKKAKAEKEAKTKVTGEERKPTETELKLIETEQSIKKEREPTAGISTPTMRQPKKLKTLQELQAINKGEG